MICCSGPFAKGRAQVAHDVTPAAWARLAALCSLKFAVDPAFPQAVLDWNNEAGAAAPPGRAATAAAPPPRGARQRGRRGGATDDPPASLDPPTPRPQSSGDTSGDPIIDDPTRRSCSAIDPTLLDPAAAARDPARRARLHRILGAAVVSGLSDCAWTLGVALCWVPGQ